MSKYPKCNCTTHIDRDHDSVHDSRKSLVGIIRGPLGERCGEPREDERWATSVQLDPANCDGMLCTGTTRRALGATCSADRRRRAGKMQLWESRSKCEKCVSCFQVIDNVREHVRADEHGIGQVLDDAAHKLRLFIAHCVRCKVQNTVIEEAYEDMLRNHPGTFGILTMDYKMKYEPKKYRQKSSEWYGRKGISWHGTVLTYKVSEQEVDDDTVTGRENNANDLPAVKHKFYDHVWRNTSEQSTFAVLSIIEMVAHHIRIDHPRMTKVVLRTHNAANYHNRVLPVVAPFIFKHYGIDLLSIIDNETQDGKGPTDLHFAVVTRFVDRYIESRCMDVVTPLDLTNAINHDHGLKGTMAEMFDVDVDQDNMKRWIEEQKKPAKDSKFQIIGRCNIIEYDYTYIEKGEVMARTRAYKYSDKVRWRFTQFSSRLEAVPNGTSVSLAIGNTEERVGAVGINGSILPTATATVTYELHEGTIVFKGRMTGVKVLVSGSSERTATPTKTLARRLFSATFEPCPDDAQFSDSDESGDEGDYGGRNFRYNGMFYYCRKCGMSFEFEREIEKHMNTCTSHAFSCLAVDQACRAVVHMIETKQIVVMTDVERNPNLQGIQVGSSVRHSVLFNDNWAVRPARGKTLGMNFVEPYKDEIKAMVDRGRADKGKKLSCAQMQEQIQLSHPNRFDIPSVHDIKNVVNAVLRAARKIAAHAVTKMQSRNMQSTVQPKNAQSTEKPSSAPQETNGGTSEEATAAEQGAVDGKIMDGDNEGRCGLEGFDGGGILAVQGETGETELVGINGRDCPRVEGETGPVGNGDTGRREADVEMVATVGDTDQRDGEVVIAEEGATKRPNARYSMPTAYAGSLEDIFRRDPKVKPRLVRGMLLTTLGIPDGREPRDFPSQQQIARKVGTLKEKMKKGKKGASCKQRRSRDVHCSRKTSVSADFT